MRIGFVLLATAAVVSATIALASADDAKTLENVRGDVSYQQPRATPNPLAPNASIALADRDYTITGANSLAQITLADSSRVMMGSNTKVQLTLFDNASIATAAFVIDHGRTRFAVIHPRGARADYRFTTPTAAITVRGTQGDIAYHRDGTLRVNVYEVCDPNLPVEVKASNGQTYTVTAGQSLSAHVVAGVVRVQIEQLTQALIDEFSPDFGVPTSWNAAKGEVVSYASNAANAATGGYAGAVASAVGGLFGRHAPQPSPTPASATCR